MFLPTCASAGYLLLSLPRLTQPKSAAVQQQIPSLTGECLPPLRSPCPRALYNKAAVCYTHGSAGQSFLRSSGGVQTCCRNWNQTDELIGSLASSPLQNLKRKPQLGTESLPEDVEHLISAFHSLLLHQSGTQIKHMTDQMQFGVLALNVRITNKLLRLSKTTTKGKTEENWSSQRAYVTPFTVVKLTAMKNIISCSSILGHTSKHHLLECKRSSPERCLPQLGAIQITGSVTWKAQRYADKWYTEVIRYWQQQH